MRRTTDIPNQNEDSTGEKSVKYPTRHAKTHDHMVRRCKWATRKRQRRRKIKNPQENTTHRKIGPYKSKNRQRERNATRKNMPIATADTDGNMERATKRKHDTWKTQTARKYSYGEMGGEMGDKYLTTWTRPGGKREGGPTTSRSVRNTGYCPKSTHRHIL